MPGRLIPLVEGEIYHVFNRGIDHRSTFTNKNEYKRALQAINFYRFSAPSIKLSLLLTFSQNRRNKTVLELEKKNQKLVDFLSFCLMPNHFHFLLKQKMENSISKFMSNFQNSHTRYFNSKHQRIGPIFLDQFKALRIETDEQLLHVSRYIHLNPYTSHVLKKPEDLKLYPWSSFFEYLQPKKKGICDKDTILYFFKDEKAYLDFVLNQADYQRQLSKIKHLMMEA